jgi:hypothetical protein
MKTSGFGDEKLSTSILEATVWLDGVGGVRELNEKHA